MSEPKKVKNNAVEFWRIIFTLGVMFFHFNVFARLRTMGKPPVGGIIMGGWVLGYFLFLTGYFMMASYMRKDARGLIDHENAYIPAWGYFWSRVKGLMPAFVVGFLFVFVTRNIAVGTPIGMYPVLLFRSLFEMLGLQQIGMLGYNDVTSNQDLAAMLFGANGEAAAWPAGFRAGLLPSNTPLWNGPGWYISAIIIVSVILYWVLCKKKDFFIGVFCPLMIIVAYAHYGLIGGENWNRGATGMLGIPTNLIRVTGGLCLGCLMYFVVEWLKERKVSQNHRTAWNIFAVILTVFLLAVTWTGTQWNEVQNNVLLLAFTVVVLVGDDAISNFLSGPMSKVSAYVGKLSLYMYISHWGLVYLLPALWPEMDYLPMAGAYVALSFVVANVVMVICDKLINPIVNPRKPAPAAAK